MKKFAMIADAMRGGGRWLVVAMVLGAFVATGHAQVIFTDTFDEDTGEWYLAYTGGSQATLTNSNERLSLTPDGVGGLEVIGRSFTSQTIGVGDTITLTFDFRQTSNTGIFRVGLYDITGGDITADNWASRSSSETYAGYTTFIRSNGSNIARREVADFSTGSGNNYPTQGDDGNITAITESGGGTNFAFEDDTDYQFTFSITRVSETQTDTVLLVMEGETERYNVVGSQTSGTHLDTFNAAALRISSGTALFDNIRVEVNPPEYFTWTGGGANGDWGDDDNWDSAPTFDDNSHVIFNADSAGNLSTFLGEARTIRAITFNENATSPVTIRTTTTSDGSDAANLTFGSAEQEGSVTVESVDAVHWIGDGGGNIVLGNNLTINHDGNSAWASRLAFGRGITGADYGIIKEGQGIVVFSGANTFTGDTVINGGTLQASTAANFSDSKHILNGSNARIRISGSGDSTFSSAIEVGPNGGILSKGGTGTVNFNGTFAATGSGNRTLTLLNDGDGAATMESTLADASSGELSINKTGVGTWVLTGNNTYSGDTFVEEGTLEITGTNAGTDYRITNTVDNEDGNDPVLKLSNVNAIPTDAKITGSSAWARRGFIDLAAAGNYTFHSYDRGNLRFVNSSGSPMTITFTEDSRLSGGSEASRTIINESENLSILFEGTLDIGSTSTIPRNMRLDTEGTITVQGGVISTGDTDGIRTLQKRRGGTVILDGTSTYTGPTSIEAGTLRVNGSLAAGSAVTVEDGATLAGSGTVGGSLTIEDGGTFLADGTALTVGGVVTLDAGSVLDLSAIVPAGDYPIVLMSYDSLDGEFDSVIGAPEDWELAYDFGGDSIALFLSVLFSDDFEGYDADSSITTAGPWSTASGAAFMTVRDEGTATPFGTPNQYGELNDDSDAGGFRLQSPAYSEASEAVTTFMFDFYEPSSGGDGVIRIGYAMGTLNLHDADRRLRITLNDGSIGDVSGGAATYSEDKPYRMFIVFNDTDAPIEYYGGEIAATNAHVWFQPLSGGPPVYAGSASARNVRETSYNVGFVTLTSPLQELWIDNVILETGTASIDAVLDGWVYLKTTQPFNHPDGWVDGEDYWSDGQPARAGYHYVVASGRAVHTPTNSAKQTFPGDSLTLGDTSSTGILRLNRGSTVGGRTTIVGDLQIVRGRFESTNYATLHTLQTGSGEIPVAELLEFRARSSDSQNRDAGFIIDASLTGEDVSIVLEGRSDAPNVPNQLQLVRANTVSGTIRVEDYGILMVKHADALQNLTLQLDDDTATVEFDQDSTVGGLAGTEDIDFGGHVISVGNNNADTTFSGQISNGSLTKIGTGTLTLSGTSTYTGATTVDAGTLRLDGSLGNTAVTVKGDATLAGGGSIGGSLTLETGATLVANGDPLDVSGAVTLLSGLVLDLTGAPNRSFVPIMSYDSTLTGTFALENITVPAEWGPGWDINYAFELGGKTYIAIIRQAPSVFRFR